VIVVMVLLTAFGAVWWLCLSPARLAGAGAVLLVAHPVPGLAFATVAALAVLVAAALLACRSLAEDGWSLVTIRRPAPAAPVAGVAS
jgi:hypothetical protein